MIFNMQGRRAICSATFERFESETSTLVKHLTGFTDGEKNYEICMEYALSNFNFHRFLDVNSHQVLRTIEGLCEKFVIHSQDEKAEEFRRLCDGFLSGKVFADHATVEVQYALISLLLNLSCNPTETLYDPCVEASSKSEDVEHFSWGRYLLEDEDVARSDTLSDLSDWSDDEISDEANLKVVGDKDQIVHAKPPVPTKPVMVAALLGECGKFQNVSKPYWVQPTKPLAFETNFPRNVIHKCSPHSCTNVELPSGIFVLLERLVIREILWLFQGLDTFLFRHDGNKYSLRKNVTIKHIMQQGFWGILTPILQYGDIVRNLKEHVSRTIGLGYCSRSGEIIPRTCQAYLACVSEILNEITLEINRVERTVFDQKKTFTLLMALEHTTPWMKKLQVLDRIHRDGVVPMANGDPCAKSCLLLNALYEYLLESRVMTSEDEDVGILTTIFLKTVKPYVDIIDGWLRSGVLEDRCDEFLIHRKEDIEILDEKFWDLTIVLRESSVDFLSPILDALTVAGKSIEILRRLGKLHEVTANKDSHSGSTRGLYDQFLEDIGSTCGSPKDPVATEDEKIDRVVDALKASEFSSIHQSLQLALFPRVKALKEHVCGVLMLVLQRDCLLDECLRNMQGFFLMEFGNVMHAFLSQVFKLGAEINIANEELRMNAMLDDALSSFIRKKPQIHVIVEGTNESACELINRFDPLTLKIQLPWPVDIVVNEGCRAKYTKIFTFLLKIKRAKYALDELRFQELVDSSGSEERVEQHLKKVKRMHVLRVNLLGFVNGFHDYMMTTVVRCGWLEFERSVENPRDLQLVVDTHNEFVNKVHEHAFLSANGSLIYKPVLGILNQCLAFESMWKKTVFKTSERDIVDVEKEMNYNRRFLSSIISMTMQKGCQSHVKALFIALMGSLQQHG